MGLQIDPRSSSNQTYYSNRKPVDFPQDEFLDLPTYVSSLRHNDRIAFIDSVTGETTTFPQLWQSVKSLAAGLAGLGIRKSDVVLILSANSMYFPIICMAVLSIGARDSAAVLAFATPSLAVKLAATKLAIVLISSSSSELTSQNDQNYISTLDKLLTSNPAHAPVVKIRQDDTATLLYSSGTTGMSKGVISTHRNLIAMVCIVLKRL